MVANLCVFVSLFWTYPSIHHELKCSELLIDGFRSADIHGVKERSKQSHEAQKSMCQAASLLGRMVAPQISFSFVRICSKNALSIIKPLCQDFIQNDVLLIIQGNTHSCCPRTYIFFSKLSPHNVALHIYTSLPI
jgi:hypothetical protein